METRRLRRRVAVRFHAKRQCAVAARSTGQGVEARNGRIQLRADFLARRPGSGCEDAHRAVECVQRSDSLWRRRQAGRPEASIEGSSGEKRAGPARLTQSKQEPRSVSETQHETAQLMMPQHANVLGHVFGGVVLSMMDTTAAVSAIRHARLACVTVSVDRVDFREPVHVGDLVIMKSSVNYVGRTSMEIGVRVETENLVTGLKRHTNSCYLTFVAIDRNGKPVPVPPLKPETPDEVRRFKAARERRERRLQERVAESKR